MWHILIPIAISSLTVLVAVVVAIILSRRKGYRQLTELMRQDPRELASEIMVLRESNERLHQFASMASHDLRAPLRAVSFYSDKVARHTEGEVNLWSQKVLHHSTRIGQLLDSLVNLSLVDRAIPGKRPVDMNLLVKEALDILQGRISTSSIKITCQKLPTIDGDWAMLSQLFRNLIDNALKHSQAENIRVYAEKRKIIVEDDGIGVDRAHLKKQFEPFFRNSSEMGQGLGLAIARRVVEKHGWTIRCKSNGGAKFIVEM